LQLEGEIDKDVIKNIKNAKNYLNESASKKLRKICPLTLCIPKICPLTLCIPKTCPLTLRTHKESPSNEIQTTLNLLFNEHKHGLYAQDFAKILCTLYCVLNEIDPILLIQKIIKIGHILKNCILYEINRPMTVGTAGF
jgi:hypothetical protein